MTAARLGPAARPIMDRGISDRHPACIVSSAAAAKWLQTLQLQGFFDLDHVRISHRHSAYVDNGAKIRVAGAGLNWSTAPLFHQCFGGIAHRRCAGPGRRRTFDTRLDPRQPGDLIPSLESLLDPDPVAWRKLA